MSDGQRAYVPARIMRRSGADNPAIRREVVRQARNVASNVRWATMPDRADVPALLHQYLQDRVPYREQQDTQSIRRPAALVGGPMDADCKSTAVFAAGMGAAAGCVSVIRFVQQPGTDWFHHVYAVLDGVAADPLLPLGQEEPYIRHEDHTIQMELEVIQGRGHGRVGAETTTMFSAAQLMAQATDWSTWSAYKWPDGNGGIRVRWWPFTGPTATMLQAHFMSNSWPGSLFAVRLMAEQEVPPSFAFMPGFGQMPSTSYYYYSQANADACVNALHDYVEIHMRERLGLSSEEPIPSDAWDVQDIPYTRETNTVIGGFIAGITGFFARFNPILIAGRAAFLSLVRANYRGLATKMAANDPERVRSRWKDWGGNWGSLRNAIEEGSTQPVGVIPLLVPLIVDAAAGGGDESDKPDNDQSGGGFGALLAAARPILDVILSALGINLDPPTDEEEQGEADADGHGDITDEVDTAANGGGGSGVAIAVGLGLLALVALSSAPNTQR